MYTNEMLEQVLTAMLDSGSIHEDTCHALLATNTKMIPRIGKFVEQGTLSIKTANSIMACLRQLRANR